MKINIFYIFGRLSKEKGVDLFCKVMTEMNLKALVIGDGSLRKNLEEKYKNIKFLGWKNKTEIEYYTKFCKAVIFPSLWYEGAPLVPLESMARGVPVLISNTCSGREYVDNNLLFTPNEKGLKNKINFLLNNKDTINESIDKYSIALQKFDTKTYKERLLEFYSEVL